MKKTINRPPIYKEIEEMIRECCIMIDRINNKNKALGYMGERLLTELTDALSNAAISLNTKLLDTKLLCIEGIQSNMWVVLSILHTIHTSEANTRCKFFTEKLFGKLIDHAINIREAQKRWFKATKDKISHD